MQTSRKKTSDLIQKMWYLGTLRLEGISKNSSHFWNQYFSISRYGKIHTKIKKKKVSNKNSFIWVLLDCHWKNNLSNSNSISSIFHLQSFTQNWKFSNLGLQMSYLGSFGLESATNIVTLDITTLEFFQLQTFVKKMKIIKL